MSQERIRPRMHRRIPVNVDFRFEGDATGEGRIIEMSEGGLSFVSSSTIAQNNALRLFLHDKEGDLHLAGTVIHVREVEGEIVIGVKFSALTEPALKSLQGMLKRHRFNLFRPPVTKSV